MISVLILTKNEELDLPHCLSSLTYWCDDIHVFDSFSTDDTLEIARKSNVRIWQRKFDGYASQRNAALDEVDYKYDWILILDADERVNPELVQELRQMIPTLDSDINGVRIRRRDFLNNKWLKNAQISPFYIRLIRRGKARYHREINEVLEVEGEVVPSNGYFDHYPFSKGYFHWLAKHNQYSSMEAQRWIDEQNNQYTFSIKKALFSRDFSEKRYHQKGLFYKIPGRPLLKWLYMIIVRRAFLDGMAGITYASLQSIYEYFIVIKSRELQTTLKKTKE